MLNESLRRVLLSAAARLPVPSKAPLTPTRILMLRPDHLGDLLFMTPALHVLRAARPDAHIAALVGPWGEAVLAGNPDLDEILTCDFPWFNRRPKTSTWGPYALLWREAARLRRRAFDLAIIMRFDFWWGATLARLAGIPQRLGYAVPLVAPFLTQPVAYERGRHEVEQNLRLVEAAGAVAPSGGKALRLRFAIPPDDATWVQARVPAGSIAVHCGAGAPVKLWSTEGWAAVANRLGRAHNATIVLTGSAAEMPLAQAVAGRLTVPRLVLAGQTNLGRLAAVYARCRLVLGADSGPLHLAVAAGAPTVHLFGPVDPALFGPWGDARRQVVVSARYFDTPCANRPCNRLDYSPAELAAHRCMHTITVDQVVQAAERVLVGAA